MTSILRRLPLTRLLLLCATVVLAGVGATAVASALDAGPVPPSEPLAQAIHEALAAQPVMGLSATIQYTNHLLEGANLASGSTGANGLATSALPTGASGRLWISRSGQARLELQAGGGDTEVILNGHTVSIYGAAPNTVYRYTLPGAPTEGTEGTEAVPATPSGGRDESATVAQIEKAIAHSEHRAIVSGAQPTDIAGQAAYTVRISPRQTGSLLGGLELSFDAVHGVPLRAAVYSSQSQAPAIELAASEVSYGPVESSVFEIASPSGAKVDVLGAQHPSVRSQANGSAAHEHPTVTTHGHGLTAVLVSESTEGTSGSAGSSLQGLPKVNINGTIAAEVATALGTVLSFERSGVRYVVAAAAKPATVEAVARGL